MRCEYASLYRRSRGFSLEIITPVNASSYVRCFSILTTASATLLLAENQTRGGHARTGIRKWGIRLQSFLKNLAS